MPEPREEVSLAQKIPRRKKEPPLVVHTGGKSKVSRRWVTVSSLAWTERLRFFLSSRGINTATSVQAVMWPSVSRLSSVVAVAPASQGKTLGWLLPVLDSLHLAQYPDLPPGHSPLCIVLCPGVEVATSLHQTLHQIVGGADLGVRSLLSCSGAPEPQPAEFYNGVDVLLASPARLLGLLQSGLVTLGRCCHLVLEDADTTLQVWAEEVHQITGEWKRSRAQYRASSQDQIIAVAEKWSNSLEGFTRTFIAKSLNTTVVFASPLEAVVYGELPMSIQYCETEEKKRKELEAIMLENDQSRSLRVVVCCRDSRTAHLVRLYVSELGKKCLIVNTESDVYEIYETLDERNTAVIAVSDPVLPCLQLAEADRGTVLIHWDLPQDSKRTFLFRLMFVRAGLRNILTGSRAQPGLVHFLLTSAETQPALNTILPFLQRCQLEVPRPLLETYEELREAKAQEGSLCLELVELGGCRQEQTGKCAGRHQVHWRLDQPASLDLQGSVVKFTILQVDSPVRYWVRLHHNDTTFTSLALKMAKHFSQPESRRPLESVRLDTLIAAADEECVYQRARVVELITKKVGEEVEKIVKVKVFMIDKGLEEEVERDDLARLPAELSVTEFPPCATRLVVSGAVPGDRDTHWGVATTISLLAMMDLERQEERDVICRAKVVLHLQDLLVVDRCQVMELQPALGKFTVKVDVVDFLVSQQGGLADKSPLRALCDMAEQAGIFRPRTEETEDTEDTQASATETKADKAFLPLGETVRVKMTECLDPANFYLALDKNWKLVENLEKDLKDYIEEGNRRRFREQSENLLVVVKDGEDYKRAEVVRKIRKVLSNEDDVEAAEPMISEDYDVLFVDEGIRAESSRQDMFHVKSEFFTRLPFQAVRCRLDGVRPAGGDRWSHQAGDRLFDLSRTEEDWPRVLDCNVASKDPDGVYSVHLWSGLDLPSETPLEENHQVPWRCGLNLAQALLQENLAVGTTETSDSFEASDDMLDEIINKDALEKIFGDQKTSVTIPGISSLSPSSPPPSPSPSSPNLFPSSSLPPLPSSPSSLPSLPSSTPSLLPSTPPPSPLVRAAPDQYQPQPVEMVQKKPNIFWSQTREFVRLNVKIFTAMDLTLDQVLFWIIVIILLFI